MRHRRDAVRVLVAAVAIGLGGALAVATLLARDGEREPRGEAASPLSARWRISPRAHLFGNPVVATIDVFLDRRRVDPDSVDPIVDFTPYEVVAQRKTRRDTGQTTHLRFTTTVRCLAPVCVPDAASKTFGLRPGALDYRRTEAGRTERVTAPVTWPSVVTISRLRPGDIPRDPLQPLPWRADRFAFGETSYRVSPGVLQASLFAGAAIFLLGAGLLAARALRARPADARPASPPRPDLSPLERAVVLVENANSNGHSAERRKALALLARELGSTGEHELGGTARRLAWSERSPARDATARLAARVREAIEERSNGRRG